MADLPEASGIKCTASRRLRDTVGIAASALQAKSTETNLQFLFVKKVSSHSVNGSRTGIGQPSNERGWFKTLKRLFWGGIFNRARTYF
jgi:hypothetical protein